jgi:hypothetical protein
MGMPTRDLGKSLGKTLVFGVENRVYDIGHRTLHTFRKFIFSSFVFYRHLSEEVRQVRYVSDDVRMFLFLAIIICSVIITLTTGRRTAFLTTKIYNFASR